MFLFTSAVWFQLGAQTPPAGRIAIRVVEGDRALNDIRARRAHAPVVSVLDASGKPVAGAVVTFLLPSTGASGTFTDAGLSLTTQTDARGVAMGRGLRPNRVPGQFRIRVTTSWKGEVASADLVQTNVDRPAKFSRNKKVALLAIIGGAAIGGVVAASSGGNGAAGTGSGGSSGGAAGGGTAIIGGNPSLGPPQ